MNDCLTAKGTFTFVLFVVLFAFSFLSSLLASENSGDVRATAELVWEGDELSKQVIFYSSMKNGKWGKPLRLSESARNSVGPTITSMQDGQTFVAWTSLEEGRSVIEYTILRDGKIIKESKEIETGLAANFGAFLAVDHEGIPWMVWSGNNGTTSDVFYTYINKGKWYPPKKVHEANKVPDILPELEVRTDGTVLVKWQSFSLEGVAINRTKILKGVKLKSPIILSQNKSVNPLECINTLPVADINFNKATLLSRCQDVEQPVQHRLIGRKFRNFRGGVEIHQ